jgi:drug/metabolite transporter (DMT)-like permease
MKILILCAVLVAAAMFENLGDAAGYLIKNSLWGQYALAIGAMSIYGALTVTVGRSGWSFTQAFPLGYLLAYFVVGMALGSLLEGRRPTGFQALAALFMAVGLLINVAGQLRSDAATPQAAHRAQTLPATVAASEPE